MCVEECPSTFGTPYEDGGDPTEVKKEMFPFCGPEVSMRVILSRETHPKCLCRFYGGHIDGIVETEGETECSFCQQQYIETKT